MRELSFLVLLIPCIAFGQWEQVGQDIENKSGTTGDGISLSGDSNVLAIGNNEAVHGGEKTGEVNVFQFVNNQWTQLGQMLIGEGDGDPSNHIGTYFGTSVRLNQDGGILAVGSPSGFQFPGKVKVFELVNNEWLPLGNTITRPKEEYFGIGVSLNSAGNILAVRSITPYNVRVYQFVNGTWESMGTAPNMRLIDLNATGQTMVLGNNFDDTVATNSGKASVYTYVNNEWVQVGDAILGEAIGDYLGSSVAINAAGDLIAIGVPGSDNNGPGSGHVAVYALENNQWVQTAHIQGPWTQSYFGNYLDMNDAGDWITIGSDEGSQQKGAVRSFKNSNGSWYKTYPEIFGQGDDLLGKSLTMSGIGNGIAFISKAGGAQNGGMTHNIVRSYQYESPPLAVNELEGTSFSIYPNPVSSQLHISNPNLETINRIDVYNVLGVSVLKEMKNIVSQSTFSIDVSELPNAVYFVHISAEDKIHSETFIKE